MAKQQGEAQLADLPGSQQPSAAVHASSGSLHSCGQARSAPAPRAPAAPRTAAAGRRRSPGSCATGTASRWCPAPSCRSASACRRCRPPPPGSGWPPGPACARSARWAPRLPPSRCAGAGRRMQTGVHQKAAGAQRPASRAARQGQHPATTRSDRRCRTQRHHSRALSSTQQAAAAAISAHRCQRGLSRSVKSSTCRSSEASPAGPMPPCTTTMLPTAAAACAARGEGGSPSGVTFSHLPLRTSMMCTSLVAPARRMPAAGVGRAGAACSVGSSERMLCCYSCPRVHAGSCVADHMHLPTQLLAGAVSTCAGRARRGRRVALGLTLERRGAACRQGKEAVEGSREGKWMHASWLLLPVQSACGSGSGRSVLRQHPPKSTSLAELRSPSGPAIVVSV